MFCYYLQPQKNKGLWKSRILKTKAYFISVHMPPLSCVRTDGGPGRSVHHQQAWGDLSSSAHKLTCPAAATQFLRRERSKDLQEAVSEEAASTHMPVSPRAARLPRSSENSPGGEGLQTQNSRLRRVPTWRGAAFSRLRGGSHPTFCPSRTRWTG